VYVLIFSQLLHCLEKLANLQVKVSDLQATGIGRTVNSLRKKPGKVGDTVRSLVTKWMAIVESHMTEDEEAQDHSGKI
jgi:elongin-A